MFVFRGIGKFEFLGFSSNSSLLFSAESDVVAYFFSQGLSVEELWRLGESFNIPLFLDDKILSVCYSGDFDYSSIKAGSVKVVDLEGSAVSVGAKDLCLAVLGKDIPHDGAGVVDVSDYPEAGYTKFFLLKNSSIYSESRATRELGVLFFSVIKENVFAVDHRNHIVRRFNLDFSNEKISSVYTNEFLISSGSYRTRCLSDAGNNVVLSIGHRSNQCDEDVRAYREGVVVAFDKATLAISWRQELEFSIDDIVSCKERLFIASGSSLYLMDQSTGSVIDVLKMPFDRKTWRLGAAQCEMFVAENLLYIPAADDNKIFLFDIEKFELVGTITLPSGWTCNKVLAKNPNGSEIFWEAELIDSSPDFHRFGLAVIDGDCLEGEVALEEPPGFDVLLKSSEKNAEEEEIWIQFEPCTLNQALRFGELCAQNLAYEHGESFTFRSPPNEKFNGKVHLRFAHIDGVKSEIDEKLIIMEKRFKKWAEQEEEIYCGMPKEIFCSLDARHGI